MVEVIGRWIDREPGEPRSKVGHPGAPPHAGREGEAALPSSAVRRPAAPSARRGACCPHHRGACPLVRRPARSRVADPPVTFGGPRTRHRTYRVAPDLRHCASRPRQIRADRGLVGRRPRSGMRVHLSGPMAPVSSAVRASAARKPAPRRYVGRSGREERHAPEGLRPWSLWGVPSPEHGSPSARSPGSSATGLVKERRSGGWCPVLHGEHGRLDAGVDTEPS